MSHFSLFSRYLLCLKISVVCLWCVWVWISFSLSCLGFVQLLECASLYLSPNLGKFSIIASSNVFPESHSFLSPGILMKQTFNLLLLSHMSQRLCSFFSLCGLQWIISVYPSTGSLILCHFHSANESHPPSFLVWFLFFSVLKLPWISSLSLWGSSILAVVSRSFAMAHLSILEQLLKRLW